MKLLVLDAASFLQERLLEGKNVRVKFITCGRSNCVCRLGKRHGPYYYARKKVNGRYVDKYLAKGFREKWDLDYKIIGNNVLFEVAESKEVLKQFGGFPIFRVTASLNLSDGHRTVQGRHELS